MFRLRGPSSERRPILPGIPNRSFQVLEYFFTHQYCRDETMLRPIEDFRRTSSLSYGMSSCPFPPRFHHLRRQECGKRSQFFFFFPFSIALAGHHRALLSPISTMMSQNRKKPDGLIPVLKLSSLVAFFFRLPHPRCFWSW